MTLERCSASAVDFARTAPLLPVAAVSVAAVSVESRWSSAGCVTDEVSTVMSSLWRVQKLAFNVIEAQLEELRLRPAFADVSVIEATCRVGAWSADA